ncbi:DUF5590 domain-containing protein [uncultured Granulicatella sp.]|uniref:cell wall elongation regulator TseB-like domain-containing protein n=1 Tax=uncultured Granulicatella sp. TaxID=316089 RepID=UPI0028D7D183|nr:DUF5590 domain-containing protein [uncultured Granulicatella sp.]
MLLFVCTFLVIFFGAARIFYLSQSERLKAKDLAVEIAAQKVQFTKITDFYWFNTEETYYSLAGITTEGQQLYAIVSPEKKEVTVLQQDAVINEQEARSITKQAKHTDEILEARLGMIKDEPVWEVNYRTSNKRIGYYYISAKNGQWIKDIENI